MIWLAHCDAETTEPYGVWTEGGPFEYRGLFNYSVAYRADCGEQMDVGCSVMAGRHVAIVRWTDWAHYLFRSGEGGALWVPWYLSDSLTMHEACDSVFGGHYAAQAQREKLGL